MTMTTVLFEDVDPFKDLHFPITFRAHVDYCSTHQWDIDTYEAQGAKGGWIEIVRSHPLWPILDGYATSQAGYEEIEGKIESETLGLQMASPRYHLEAAE